MPCKHWSKSNWHIYAYVYYISQQNEIKNGMDRFLEKISFSRAVKKK